MFKIATWNVNSLNVRLPHVLQWMQREDPDVFALQETKSIDENFPIDAIKEQGYHVSFAGQKTYNGVATISKSPIETISSSLPNYNDEQRRVLAINTLNLVNISSIDLVSCPSAKASGSIISVILPNFLSACSKTSFKTA